MKYKPRGACVLEKLPPAHQHILYEYMEGVGGDKGHTYAECIAWLQSKRLQINASQLSRWRTRYLLRLRFQWCHNLIDMMVEDDRKPGETHSDEDIQRKGNRLFSLLATKTCDDKAWARARSLQVRQQAMFAVERKLEFAMQKYDDARPKVVAVESDTNMTPEEKEERIRQILGTD